MSVALKEVKLDYKPTDEKALKKALLSKNYVPPTKPLGDRILIKPIDKGPKEIGGLIIPETAHSQEGPREGYVAAIGSGVVILDYGGGVYETRTKTLELKIGDRIFYNYLQAVKIDYPENGEVVRYEMIHEDQIIGIFLPWTGEEVGGVKSMWPGWWMQPRGNRVLVEWLEATDTFTVGDFELKRTETSKENHFTGIILGYGDKCMADCIGNTKIGDRVFFDQFSGEMQYYQWKHDGKRYAILKDWDLHCLVPDRIAETMEVR